MSPAIRDVPNPDNREPLAALPRLRVQEWSGPTDLEASKVDGSYAHNNKITVAECARDWACDPLGIAAKRGRS
jgi:hypothetical protein